MNESAARRVTLLRAVETTDGTRAIWSDDDRAWATRAAAEITGANAAPDVFVARRAALALERLRTRHPSFARALRALAWRSWIGPVLALIAFVVGVATNYLGPERRVNILAFPLLALLGWNLAVYALIVVRGAWGLAAERGRGLGPLARAVARLGRRLQREPVARDAPVAMALAMFFGDWARVTAPLTAARVGRSLHFAAFALALGALAGLYVRGLVLEYRAGWESTFLDAGAVHGLLSFVLGPASALTGIPVADVPRLEAIRFGAGGTGENAAPWIHLYAATMAIVILLPRLALGIGTWLAERRRTTRFPIAFDDPYFQRLLRQVRREPARVRIVPYSYQLPPQAVLGLHALATRVFGTHLDLSIAPSIEWGGEDALPDDAVPSGPFALAAIVFTLAATPEPSNHGAFVAAVDAKVDAGTPLAVLVDESGFRRRFAREPARLDERRDAWRETLAAQRVAPVFVDLDSPDLAAAEAQLAGALDRHSLEGPGR